MKQLFTLLAALILSTNVLAQSPQKMSYQAVIRNSTDALVTNHTVGMKISILKGSATGTVVYSETQTPSTNSNGLISIEIGNGTGFNNIDWKNGPFFIKTETDPGGGTSYTITGTSQLLSVPFALFAKTAESISGSITETDPVWNTASSNYYSKTNMQTSGSAQMHFNNLTNKPTTVAGYGISDAMTTAHAANGITSTNISNWTTAFGWGNHAGLYRPINYVPSWSDITSNPFSFSSLTNNQLMRYNSTSGKWENFTPDFTTSPAETDPIWTAASSNYYSKTNMQTSGSSQIHFNNLTNKPTTVVGYGISDAMTTAHAANGITSTNISNWTTAFGWGNHSGLYRPINYVPAWSDITSNPFSFSSPTNNQLMRYNSTSGKWENFTPDFTTSPAETDPIWTAVSTNYYTKTNMQTSGSSQIHFNNLTNKPSTVAGYGISDAMTTAHAANGITSTNISNWTTAFGWGNHSGLYRPINYVPAWSDITSNPFSITSVANNQLLKYNSTTSKWENWTPDFLKTYTETDPTWTAASTNYYTKTNMQTSGSSQIHFNNLTNKPTTVAGYGITDAMTTAHVVNALTATDITNWNTAFGWGNHASAGYQPLVAAGTNTQYWRGDKTWQTLNQAAIGLGNVENTALSTWFGSANITILGAIASGVWNAGAVTSSGYITGTKIIKSGGTASQFLKADGSVDANTYITAIREVADEFSATASQTSFTLTQTPSANSKVKMYINGVRISNSAYSVTGTALSYVVANNGAYALMAGDRIQFDYYY